jgi:hypothetical protein
MSALQGAHKDLEVKNQVLALLNSNQKDSLIDHPDLEMKAFQMLRQGQALQKKSAPQGDHKDLEEKNQSLALPNPDQKTFRTGNLADHLDLALKAFQIGQAHQKASGLLDVHRDLRVNSRISSLLNVGRVSLQISYQGDLHDLETKGFQLNHQDQMCPKTLPQQGVHKGLGLNFLNLNLLSVSRTTFQIGQVGDL